MSNICLWYVQYLSLPTALTCSFLSFLFRWKLIQCVVMDLLPLQVLELGSSLVLCIHANMGVRDAFWPVQSFSFFSLWWERFPDPVALRDVVIIHIEGFYRESDGLRGKVSLSILPSVISFLTSQSRILVPEISLHAESPQLFQSFSLKQVKIPTSLGHAHCRNTLPHFNKALGTGSFTVSDYFPTKNCPLE